jgi:N-acetylmuramoyl-L-alanine amidase
MVAGRNRARVRRRRRAPVGFAAGLGLAIAIGAAAVPAAAASPPNQYTVQQGDTFWSLARRSGTTVSALEAANPNVSAWGLYPGLQLQMPAAGSDAAPVSAASGSGASGGGAGVAATQTNINLLARIAAAEEGNRSLEDQIGVDAVVLNRVASRQFPNTVPGVIFQPGQFTSVANGYYYNVPVTATSIRAAQDALAGADPTGGALYFYDPAQGISSSWVYGTSTLTVIDGTVYSI